MQELNYKKVSDKSVVGCYKLWHKSLIDFYAWLQKIPNITEIQRILAATGKKEFEDIVSITNLISYIDMNLVSCFTFKINNTTTIGFDLNKWMLILMGSEVDVADLAVKLENL